jgi:hypothetical protein
MAPVNRGTGSQYQVEGVGIELVLAAPGLRVYQLHVHNAGQVLCHRIL